MAIFESKENEKKEYIVLLDKTGENVVAFINPAKNVRPEILVAKLETAGMKAEIRETNSDALDFDLV